MSYFYWHQICKDVNKKLGNNLLKAGNVRKSWHGRSFCTTPDRSKILQSLQLSSDLNPNVDAVLKGDPYLIAIDTETSAFHPKPLTAANCLKAKVRVLSLGWAVFDKRGKLLPNYPTNQLIKPEGFDVTKEAEEFHGISTEFAERNGKPAKEVFSAFCNDVMALSKNGGIAVAHNMNHDLSLILNEINKFMVLESDENLAKESSDFLYQNSYCTLGYSKVFNPEDKWMKLSRLFSHAVENPLEEFNLPIPEEFAKEAIDGAHQAGFDAFMAGYSFFWLSQHKNAMSLMKYQYPSIAKGGTYAPMLSNSDDVGTDDINSGVELYCDVLPEFPRESDFAQLQPNVISIECDLNTSKRLGSSRCASVSWALFDNTGSLIEGYPYWCLVSPEGWEVEKSQFRNYDPLDCKLYGISSSEMLLRLFRDINIVASNSGVSVSAIPHILDSILSKEIEHAIEGGKLDEQSIEFIREAYSFMKDRSIDLQQTFQSVFRQEHNKKFFKRAEFAKKLREFPEAVDAMYNAGVGNERNDGYSPVFLGAIFQGMKVLGCYDRFSKQVALGRMPKGLFPPPTVSDSKPAVIGISLAMTRPILEWMSFCDHGDVVSSEDLLSRKYDLGNPDQRSQAFVELLADLRKLPKESGRLALSNSEFAKDAIYSHLSTVDDSDLTHEEQSELKELIEAMHIDVILGFSALSPSKRFKSRGQIVKLLSQGEKTKSIIEKSASCGNSLASQNGLIGLSLFVLKNDESSDTYKNKFECTDSFATIDPPIGEVIDKGFLSKDGYDRALTFVSFGHEENSEDSKPISECTEDEETDCVSVRVKIGRISKRHMEETGIVYGSYGEAYLSCQKFDGQWSLLPGSALTLRDCPDEYFAGSVRTLFVKVNSNLENNDVSFLKRLGGVWDSRHDIWCFQFHEKLNEGDSPELMQWETTDINEKTFVLYSFIKLLKPLVSEWFLEKPIDLRKRRDFILSLERRDEPLIANNIEA